MASVTVCDRCSTTSAASETWYRITIATATRRIAEPSPTYDICAPCLNDIAAQEDWIWTAP